MDAGVPSTGSPPVKGDTVFKVKAGAVDGERGLASEQDVWEDAVEIESHFVVDGPSGKEFTQAEPGTLRSGGGLGLVKGDAEYAREIQRKLDDERRMSKHLHAPAVKCYQEQKSRFGGNLSEEQIIEHMMAESELEPGEEPPQSPKT